MTAAVIGSCDAGRSARHDHDDIFPDPNSQALAQTWWSDPKSFERAFSGAAAA